MFAILLHYLVDNEISVGDLKNALCGAATVGDIKVVEALKACSRFKDIARSTFEAALSNAVLRGYLEIVKALMECNRFKEIDSQYVKEWLRLTARFCH